MSASMDDPRIADLCSRFHAITYEAAWAIMELLDDAFLKGRMAAASELKEEIAEHAKVEIDKFRNAQADSFRKAVRVVRHADDLVAAIEGWRKEQ